MSKIGIDVSSYQGVIDWLKVKTSGIEFAILKVIRKDLDPDKQFKNNLRGCIEAALPVQGVYNYSYATTVYKAISDAKRVIEVLKETIQELLGISLAEFLEDHELTVWLDVENECQKGLGTLLIDIINSYAEVIEGAGLKFGVYTGNSFYNSYIKPYGGIKHSKWIARYGTNNGTLNEKYKPTVEGIDGWQYTSRGRVDGISGNVDMDIWYDEGEEKSMVKPVDYKQNDSRWGGLSYAVDGEISTIKSAGCGPTALADVLAAIVSPYIDPVTLAAWARYNNYKVKNNGTSYSFFVPCAAAYGLKVRRLNTVNLYNQPTHAIHAQALAALKEGNWIIACMGKGLWTSSGHYVVAYGYADDKVYINDPASTKAARACNIWEMFKSQVKYYWVVEVPEHIKQNGSVADGEYRHTDFVREVQFCTGATPDGIQGTETLSKTITVSAKKNRKHFVVMPLQKVFRKRGYYAGKIDKIAGKLFTAAVNGYQENVLKYSKAKQDGEITAKKTMWKKLLGLL